MSSYGEHYSDEERNFIEHAGGSQGESDIEGESESESVVEGGVDGRSGGGGGGGGDNGEGSAATSGEGGSRAVDRSDSDTHGVSESEGIGGVEDNCGANEANGFGWYVRQNAAGDWNEGDVQTSSSGWATGGNSSGNIKEGEVAVRSQFPRVDSLTPVSSLTPKEFCERLKLFRSPDVTLIVGPEETVFTLPKDLLCQHSTFFDRAFNSKFKEGVDLTMRLPEDTVAAFQMMIQWIYTGSVVVASCSDGCYDLPGMTSFYLDFFKLADKIDLLGPLTSILNKFGDHLSSPRCQRKRSDCTEDCASNPNDAAARCSCGNGGDDRCVHGWGSYPRGSHQTHCDIVYRNCSLKASHIDPLRDGTITSEHIYTATELRPGNEARQMLVQACVTSYVLSASSKFNFKFEEELGVIDGFSQDLLREVAQAIDNPDSFRDPLNGMW